MDDQTLFYGMSVLVFVALLFGFMLGSYRRTEKYIEEQKNKQ